MLYELTSIPPIPWSSVDCCGEHDEPVPHEAGPVRLVFVVVFPAKPEPTTTKPAAADVQTDASCTVGRISHSTAFLIASDWTGPFSSVVVGCSSSSDVVGVGTLTVATTDPASRQT